MAPQADRGSAPAYDAVGGASALGPDLTALLRRLDDLFLQWAAEVGAEEWSFPPLLPARAMARIDYFASFPHLVTLPAALAPSDENLARFADTNTTPAITDRDGALALGALAPVREILAPAACYPLYLHLEGARLERPRYFTLRSVCFRREAEYAALERQWSFSMREIVCVGDAETVHAFLDRFQSRLASIFARLGWPIAWQPATDPFFRSERSPKHLLQSVDPVKHELVADRRLAIGSSNLHHSYFGEAFDIRCGGEPAHTGCVAFGLDRWTGWIARHVGEKRTEWAELALWRE